MLNILVNILTSSKINLLKICYDSIKTQYSNFNFKFDIFIIVNSLNENYYIDVKNKFKDYDVEIIQTESNGYPGKGHNSVLKEFQKRTKYNYLIMIDGDDILYPSAFELINKTLKLKPDIIHLMTNDAIITKNTKYRNINIIGNLSLRSTFEQKNWWKTMKLNNPMKNYIYNCTTPSRLLLLSRNIFNTDIKIEYDEDLTLYDDYIAFLSIIENILNNSLRCYAISNEDIYLYNCINDNSVSNNFDKKNYEDIIFKQKALKYKKSLEYFGNKKIWNFDKLKYVKITKNNNFSLEHKINFVKNIINQITSSEPNIEKLLIKNNTFNKNFLSLKKKILCYYTGYSDYFNGKNYGERYVYGSEISAINLCEHLSKKYNTYIFCKCKLNEEILYNGVQYYDISKFKKFQESNDIDILIISRFIHFFLEYTCKSKKIYYILHDARINNKWNNIYLPNYGLELFYNVLHNIDKIICLTEWHKNYFQSITNIPDNKIKIIPHGINLDNYKIRKKITNKFIYCSNPNRGLSVLIKIFIQISEIYDNCTLDIYFDAIEDDNLLKIIKKYKNINFYGKISNVKLAQKLCESDFFFYPNIYSHETFCMSILEAMAGSNVIISTDYSGIKDVVKDCGILINFNKNYLDKFINESIKNIKHIIENIDIKEKYQKLARNRAKQFQWNIIYKLWLNLIN